MQRSIQQRTMRATEQNYNTRRAPEEAKEQPSGLNYCPLPAADPKKEEVDRLLAEYDQLHRRLHQVRHRLQQLGFNQN